MDETVVQRRSLIIVSAPRPDDFQRAAGCGADIVSADFEDDTPPDGMILPKVADADEVRIVAAAKSDTVGITRLDGRMVNGSIVRFARRILAAAEAIGNS